MAEVLDGVQQQEEAEAMAKVVAGTRLYDHLSDGEIFTGILIRCSSLIQRHRDGRSKLPARLVAPVQVGATLIINAAQRYFNEFPEDQPKEDIPSTCY